MFKLKKAIVTVGVLSMVLGNVLMVSASNSSSYGPLYVTKTSDYISGGIKKAEQSAASNLVSEVQDGRSLCCWIINASGDKMTDKPSYSSANPVYMNYSNQVEAQGTVVRLKISTTLSNFTDTRTWGYWCPDYITHV